MGKPFTMPEMPKERRRAIAGMPLWAWGLLALGLLVLAALGALLYFSYFRPQLALPAAPQIVLPAPQGPALPQKTAAEPEGPRLPQAPPPAAPQPSVAQAPPPPEKKEPSGTVTWAWQLYPVSPSILGVQIQNQMPGYQFVALGLWIWNNSTEYVPVDNNAFLLNVDGRIYRSDQFSTADAVINGLPFLAPTTLAPGGQIQGQTGFMIPRVYRQISADWQINLPPTIKIVRVDPKTPFVPAQQYTPPPPPKGEMPWEDPK